MTNASDEKKNIIVMLSHRTKIFGAQSIDDKENADVIQNG